MSTQALPFTFKHLQFQALQSLYIHVHMIMSTAPQQQQQQRHRRLRLRRVFDLFDRDGDGVITAAELSGALGRLGLGLGAPPAGALDAVVAAYITPGMPGLRFTDFESLHAELVGGAEDQGDEEEEMREAFGVFDEDGDGYISPAELQVVLARMGMPEAGSMERVRDMIAAHDRDSDGRVDFEEFKAMMAGGNGAASSS